MANLAKTRDWFEEWREPGEFFRAANGAVKTFFIADKTLPHSFTLPHFMSEAYVAGAFARIWGDSRGPCEVRLVSETRQFPDAQLKTTDSSIDLEITLALAKGKEMIKEWRELNAKAKRGEFALAQTTEQRQANAREAIPRAVGRKADKHYAGQPPTLLVYSDDAVALSGQEIARLTEPWKNHFEAIYLLAGMDAVRAWPTLQVLRGKEPP